MNIVIKKMETDDEFKGKAYVHWKAWQEAYTGIVDQGYLDGLTLEKCEEIAYKWPGNIYVAKDGEKVVGFVGYGDCRNEDLQGAGEIFAIYVLKEYYGTGAGKALMDKGLEVLDKSEVVVWVLKDNSRAIRFYEKCGFRSDGTEKEIELGAQIIEIRMVRKR